MTVNWTLVVEAMKALAWPVVAAFALFLLRRPLAEVVAQIARRARKVSVFEVSVELATLPELQPSWSTGTTDARRLSSAQIFDSASQSLFQELLSPGGAEYAIVDLRSGNAWLTSRLFIFALILGEVSGLRAFVFLETVGGTRRRFLGVSTPASVRRALGKRYPWLEEAFARSVADSYPKPQAPVGTATPPAVVPREDVSVFVNQAPAFVTGEQWQVTDLVRKFVEKLQRQTAPLPNEVGSYLEVDTSPPAWERTHWIDGERLERDLVGVLEYAWVEDSPDRPRSLVSESVMRRQASFVAMVDSDRRFISLVDRYALLADVAARQDGSKNNSTKEG
jgi:hypothetical protein